MITISKYPAHINFIWDLVNLGLLDHSKKMITLSIVFRFQQIFLFFLQISKLASHCRCRGSRRRRLTAAKTLTVTIQESDPSKNTVAYL
jgi:hypothetical protein